MLFLEQAFYNWAIAISDRAKARGRTKEAEELWKEVVLVIVCNLAKVCIIAKLSAIHNYLKITAGM